MYIFVPVELKWGASLFLKEIWKSLNAVLQKLASNYTIFSVIKNCEIWKEDVLLFLVNIVLEYTDFSSIMAVICNRKRESAYFKFNFRAHAHSNYRFFFYFFFFWLFFKRKEKKKVVSEYNILIQKQTLKC